MNFLQVRYRFDDPHQHGLGKLLRDASPGSDRARSHLLASAVKITSGLFPALAEGLRNLGTSMMLEEDVDCFVAADPVIQASCIAHQTGGRRRFTVLLTSALVERLRMEEIRFVIGHEVGHFLCEHWRYPREDDDSSLGDRLAFLRLSRAAEISADRIGMLACGSLEDSCAAMIKVAAGLGAPFLQPDIPSILSQFRELARSEGSEAAMWATHPIIPLRVRALLRFDTIFGEIRRCGTLDSAELAKIDDEVEADFHRSSGFALRRITDKNLELVRVWGLVALLAADGVITKKDQELMVSMLGADTSAKALGFLRSSRGSLDETVAQKLMEASVAARLAPKSDRQAIFNEFQGLILEIGDTPEEDALEAISTLLELD